jgi:hypothetical protein
MEEGPEDATTRAATALEVLRGLLDTEGGTLGPVELQGVSGTDEPVGWPLTRDALAIWFGSRSIEAAGTDRRHQGRPRRSAAGRMSPFPLPADALPLDGSVIARFLEDRRPQ